MKRKHILLIFAGVFLSLSVLLLYDTVSSYSEISKNRVKIEKIESKQQAINRENIKIRRKIDRISKDPRAAEEILRLKYKMLRKDQFRYVPEK